MCRILVWGILTLLGLSLNTSHAQEVSFNQQFYEAERLMQEENYSKATPIFEKLLSKDPENGNLQFKLGYCYLNSSVDKAKALDILEKAVTKKSKKYNPENPKEKAAPYETDFFLAQAQFHNQKFINADKLFNDFKAKMKPYLDESFLAEIDKFINWNNNAAKLVSSPIDVKKIHLPEGINTSAIEYAPVLSGDENTLIFTSNRSGGGDLNLENSDDLYIVKKDDEKWGMPKRMTDVINTSGHEASASLSFDGLTLIIYINDNGNGELYKSQFDGENWSKPEPLSDLINSPNQETHGSFSPDNNDIYFTSDRPDGYGGLDIYMSRKLPNGQWGMPVNLGPEINTPFDEETPFMHPNNKRLYFSSGGHNSMGGLDIFVAQRNENETWTKPENIGYPINSTSDDVCFSVSADGMRGYYSSFNEESLGETDLFMIEMPGEDHTNLMVYIGFAKNGDNEVIANADITAFDEATGEMVGVYTPNKRTGKFVLAAPKGMLIRLTIEAKGYAPIEKLIKIGENNTPEKQSTEFSITNIELESLSVQEDTKTETSIEENILMPYDSYETDLQAYTKVIELLEQNDKGQIQLTGHTDSKGPAWYNDRLSIKRATFVQQYLMNNGISKRRISIKGKGESMPIAKNSINGEDSPEGRAFNRRVSIKLLNIDAKLYKLTPLEIPEQLIEK